VLQKYMEMGGPIMWPLLAASIIGVLYILERFYSFWRARLNPRKFVARVKEALQAGGVSAALELCDRTPSPVARILAAALEKKQYGREAMEEAVAMAGARELAFLDRGMLVLAAITTIAPMLGFLGTVSGMVNAFDAIAIAGEMEPSLVASGIKEALITTMTGLAIAVPMAAAHVFFTTRVNAYTRAMEEATAELMESVLEERR
jgi:biopolymer transport protein ExbB